MRTDLIGSALQAHALGSARVFETDRSQTVGASEIGRCARNVWYAKNEGDHAAGVLRDEDAEDRWGARVRGSVFEDAFWVPAMRASFGERLLFAGHEQRTLVSEFLSATPDGVLVDLTADEQDALGITGPCATIDCKTADPRTRLGEAKPEHAYQAIVQIGLVRELTTFAPTHGLLSYTDASFWDEGKTFAIAFNQSVFDTAKRRARTIMTAPNAQALAPEGVIAGGKECERCVFTAACGQKRADLVPRGDAKAAMPADIAAMALDARSHRDGADGFMKAARRIENEIREAMARHGTRKMAGETADGRALSISWAAMNGRPSLDVKGLREAAIAAGVDVSRFEKAGDPTDRLLITLNGSSKEEKAA